LTSVRKTGQLVLSHRKARTIKSWDRVISANETEKSLMVLWNAELKVWSLMFSELKLLPGSQIDVKPIRDYDVYVNKTMELLWKSTTKFKTLLYLTNIEADIEVQKKKSSVN
jgi:small subunit ribosomal protein S1